MAWVDILTHQEALRTPAVKISGPEKKDFEVGTCACVCSFVLVRTVLTMHHTIYTSYYSYSMLLYLSDILFDSTLQVYLLDSNLLFDLIPYPIYSP